MASTNPGPYQQTEQYLADLRALRQFPGPAAEFWPAYLGAACRLALSPRGLLMTADAHGTCSAAATWPAQTAGQSLEADLVARAATIAAAALQRGYAASRAPQGSPRAGALSAFRLDEGPGLPPAAVVLLVPDAPIDQLEASTLVLRLVADIPASYLRDRALTETTGETLRFAEAFDLMVLLNQDQRFLKAALVLCNELATRYGCSRVSLGWRTDEDTRLQAMSHVEKFERRTAAVRALEAAMEESAEQDEDIVVPRSASGPGPVTRAHQEYARELNVAHVASLPLRLEQQVVAVLTCERQEHAFGEDEVRGLRLVLSQATRRLADLKRHDRWIGARLWTDVKESLAWVLGARHTLPKLAALATMAVAAFIAFGTWDYHVDALFVLKTDDLSAVPAPFDGYISEVPVRIGDTVKAGDLMLSLDTRELLLDEASATAEISRYTWEAEKQRAKNELVDMRVSQALRAQAQARYDKVHFNLENARLRAPFAGVVVEGDLKKMLGAPVRKGDMLLKVARLENLYAEIDVPERDIAELRDRVQGTLSFVSRPESTFPVVTDPPDPVASAKDNENVFTVRANPTAAAAAWWRPGMSGVAKLEVGRRPLWWIISHRTIDYLRLWAWW